MSFKTWTSEVLTAADLNGNFALCVRTDSAKTITVTHIYTASQTFTGGWTAGAACTISTGGLTVTAGGVTITAGGLQFPATQSASADPNNLDDYEEGTWTAGVAFGGGTTGITYSSQSGTYTKVGRKVTVIGRAVLTNKGSSTGAATVTGLPFAVLNDNGGYGVGSLYLQTVTFADYPMIRALINTTTAELYEVTNAGTLTSLTDVDFANTSQVYFTLTYHV